MRRPPKSEKHGAVFRGRARGNNEPQRPVHVFDGDMNDDAALRAWIAGLAAQP